MTNTPPSFFLSPLYVRSFLIGQNIILLSEAPYGSAICSFISYLCTFYMQYACLLIEYEEKVMLYDWCLFFCQAYIFRDYWEDIGTIKSYYDASLALTEEVYFIVFKTDIFEFHIGLIPIHNFMKCTLIAHDKRVLTPKDIMTLAQMAFPLRRGWNLES